jgi:hypothetical protein
MYMYIYIYTYILPCSNNGLYYFEYGAFYEYLRAHKLNAEQAVISSVKSFRIGIGFYSHAVNIYILVKRY